MIEKDWDDAKDLFGKTLKTAHVTGKCISCNSPARKKNFKDSERCTAEEAWEEYKLDGLCQKCSDECYAPI